MPAPPSADPEFMQAALDALAAHIAILDAAGHIVTVNAGWAGFGPENHFLGAYSRLGDDYPTFCETMPDECAPESVAVARGLREVLRRERESFQIEYPCDGDQGRRWFALRVTRLAGRFVGYVAVAHEDITPRREAEDRRGELERRLAEEHEQARARVGEELHENLAQELLGISLMTLTIEDELAQTPGRGPANLAELRRLIDAAIGRARELANQSYPVALLREGLGVALSGLADSFTRLRDVSCVVTVEDMAGTPAATHAINIYRLAQELVVQLIQRAGSQQIRLAWRAVNGHPTLQVEADGRSLATEWLKPIDGGLLLIAHRAQSLGATIDWQARVAADGNIIVCTLPRSVAAGDS